MNSSLIDIMKEWTSIENEGNKDFLKITLGDAIPPMYIELSLIAAHSSFFGRLVALRENELKACLESYDMNFAD